VQRHVVEGGDGEYDARVTWWKKDISYKLQSRMGCRELWLDLPMMFGMKRKMFSFDSPGDEVEDTTVPLLAAV
jgi:hypothetical protein